MQDRIQDNGYYSEKKVTTIIPLSYVRYSSDVSSNSPEKTSSPKHNTNYKCAEESCTKAFAEQYQFDAHMKVHMHRSCYVCGKQFQRKQHADVHLINVHGLTKEDLATLGR